jgi:hypothetical protein
MEAASTSETSVNFYQIARRYNAEEIYLPLDKSNSIHQLSRVTKFGHFLTNWNTSNCPKT